jgi:hypothetical protein
MKNRKQAKKGKSNGKPRNGIGQTYSAPSAVGKVITSQEPLIKRKGKSTNIKFREYVRDITGSVGFIVIAQAINPGNGQMFPWLAPQARQYEEYKFRKLRFCFETFTSTNATGTVIFAVDYDPSDPLPVSKTEILTNDDKARSSPWLEFSMLCSMDNLAKRQANALFVSESGAAPLGEDPKLYNLGNLLVATQSFAAAVPCGELWVEYDIDLITPQTQSTGAPIVPAGWFAKEDGLGSIPSTASGQSGTVQFDLLSCIVGTVQFAIDALSHGMTGLQPGLYKLSWRQELTTATGITSGLMDIRRNGTTVFPSTNARPIVLTTTSLQTAISMFCTVLLAIAADTDIITFVCNCITNGAGAWLGDGVDIVISPAAAG